VREAVSRTALSIFVPSWIDPVSAVPIRAQIWANRRVKDTLILALRPATFTTPGETGARLSAPKSLNCWEDVGDGARGKGCEDRD